MKTVKLPQRPVLKPKKWERNEKKIMKEVIEQTITTSK